MVMLEVVEHYLAAASRGGKPIDRDRFVQDIRGWYLVQALDWTLDGIVVGDEARVDEGVESLMNDLLRTVWPLP